MQACVDLETNKNKTMPSIKATMKLLNLNADILLEMTSYLSDRDKIRLSKFLKGVSAQVTSCSINSGPGIDLVELAVAFQKLENVRKVTITELGWGWSTGTIEQEVTKQQIMKIIAHINPSVQEFVFDHPDTSINDIAIYIEQVKQEDQTYDASSICHVFQVDTKSASQLEYILKKYPDLKLKLKCKLEPPSMLRQSTDWVMAQRHLVTDLTIKSTFTVGLTEYPSVTNLTLIDNGGSPSDCLREAVQALPLLSDVDIVIDVNNVSLVFEQLLSINNFKSLKAQCYKYLWTSNDFETFEKLLARGTLRSVHLNTLRGNHFGVLNGIAQCSKSNFKSFLVRSDMFVALKFENQCLELKKPLFKEISIMDLVSKFKKLRVLSIDAEDQISVTTIKEMFAQIVLNRPRNAPRLDLKLNLPKSNLTDPFPFLTD